MSLSVAISVVCDQCYDQTDESHWRGYEARDSAKEMGWHRTRDGRDMCEECWEEGYR